MNRSIIDDIEMPYHSNETAEPWLKSTKDICAIPTFYPMKSVCRNKHSYTSYQEIWTIQANKQKAKAPKGQDHVRLHLPFSKSISFKQCKISTHQGKNKSDVRMSETKQH